MVRKRVEQWLDEFIVGHNICPFARRPLSQGLLKLLVLKSKREEDLNQTLLQALENLVISPRSELETTIIVIPHQLSHFDDFWSYWEWTQDILIESGVEGLVQIVGFHPGFRFAGSDYEDAANFVNRSPFPLLHLLREESVEEANEQHPDITSIPERNALYLRRLSKIKLEELVYGNDDRG
ncbi:MAG: DUF1415 domain-containing protein [Bacteroidota bacterium]